MKNGNLREHWSGVIIYQPRKGVPTSNVSKNLSDVARFAVALNIPNQMKLSQYMMDCCSCLQTEQKNPVDATLAHMIQLGQLSERIYIVLGPVTGENVDTDNIGLLMHMHSLLSHLKELETKGRLATNKSGERILS